MIFGRPQNVILGAFTALFNVVVIALSAEGISLDPLFVAAINVAAASIIGVIAYQPPTLNPGDTFNVVTPPGQPSAVTTVATPPAADAPPVPDVPVPTPPAKGG